MKENTAPSGSASATTGGDLVDHVVQAGDRVVPGREGVHDRLEPVGAPQQQDDADDDPRHAASPDLRGGRLGFGAGRLRRGIVAAESSWLRSAGEVQISFGCQTFRKPIRQAIEISEAPISTIQGLMKLEIRNCGIAKETPVTRIAGQISFMPLPAGEGPDQPERHDQREERQLPADHGAEQERIDAGHAGEAGDRRAERAVGDRRGVGDQRQAGGRERREAEPDQDRAGHRDRRAEAGGALEEGAEAEGDQQELQPAVGR